MITKTEITEAIILLRDIRWKCVEHILEFDAFYEYSNDAGHMSILPEYCDDTTIYLKSIGVAEDGSYLDEDSHAEVEIRHLLNPEILRAKILAEEHLALEEIERKKREDAYMLTVEAEELEYQERKLLKELKEKYE
jgi:hypothetical protein